MMKAYQKAAALLLALAFIFAFPITASAAETTEARVPVTLTVVNTVAPISCTVPAALPISLVDGYVGIDPCKLKAYCRLGRGHWLLQSLECLPSIHEKRLREIPEPFSAIYSTYRKDAAILR